MFVFENDTNPFNLLLELPPPPLAVYLDFGGHLHAILPQCGQGLPPGHICGGTDEGLQ